MLMSMLAPPLAALVGMGIVELWRLRQELPWLALGLLLASAGGTLALQIMTTPVPKLGSADRLAIIGTSLL
jgi:hypothetical protein